MIPIILAGGGGHCRSCIDVIEAEGKYLIKGIVEPIKTNILSMNGYDVIGCDDDLPELIKDCPNALVTIGQIKSPETRIRIFKTLKTLNTFLPIVTSPFAYVSSHAKVDEGTILMHGVIINSEARIGKNCIINSQSLIEHDVVIESHCHISTGVKINGSTIVREGSFIGSGAILREGITIGKGSVIGAGKVILQDVPDGSILRSAS
tara:strand:- start:1961 stop:2578 length:618 start_codon:yes stop_codon:yes gene_type:complete